MIKNFLLIGLGGGIGSMARYLVQKWFNENYPHPFPWGTFTINVIGCFLIGMIYAASEKTALVTPQVRLLLITGFCGGFTTFSTFAFENMTLLRSGDILYFMFYILVSVILGVLAVYAGMAVTKLL